MNEKRRSQKEIGSIYNYYKSYGCRATCERYGATKDTILSLVGRVNRGFKRQSSLVTAEKAQKYRLGAIKYASSRGSQHLAEDFGSYCTVRLYQGQTSPIQYMLTDFKRTTMASSRTRAGRAKMAAKSVDEASGLIATEPKDDRSLFESLDGLNDLNDRQRMIFLLHVDAGVPLKDLAYYMRLDPSRVSQILGECKQLLKKEYEK